MTKEEKEKLIPELIKSEDVRKTYDTYIIKEIPFETWVRNTVDRILINQVVSPIAEKDFTL